MTSPPDRSSRVVVVTAPAGTSGALPDAVTISRARTLRDRHPELVLPSLVRMPALDAAAGSPVMVLVESGQLTGSFKVRGALLALESVAEKTPGASVVAASAGNHGAGVAYAASRLGLTATIVVPRSAPRAKTDKMRAAGATVIVASAGGYDEAEAEAMTMAADRGLRFVSPYDDPEVLAGNGASLAYDLLALLGEMPARVVLPFGGGGLATGVAVGLADAAGEAFGAVRRVWGAQSQASCAMALSLARGAAMVSLACDAPTFAEGLEGGISVAAFERARAVIAGVLTVDEASIARAMMWVEHQLDLRVEGSAAVALAPLLGELPAPVRPEVAGKPLVVVLTGSNVDPERFEQARAAARV